MHAEEPRDKERSLAVEYGIVEASTSLVDENLESGGPRDAQHWVEVYNELVDFSHDLTNTPSGEAIYLQRAIAFQAKPLEVHLAFWSGHAPLSSSSRINVDQPGD